MNKIYRSIRIGDGKTIETAYKPEVTLVTGILYEIIKDEGNYFIVEVEASDAQHKEIEKLANTSKV